ncbi:MAG TPA: pirin family protein [Alphaproteobacteria bacterium]|nr:pirin family protein [Alphaproteobacteria bacterium]
MATETKTKDAAGTRAARGVTKTIPAMPTQDGGGVSLNRAIGNPRLSELDPFLLLDEIRSDDPGAYIAGFPEHPHRGFETVTYMLAGKMRHGDNKGHNGVIEAGDVQWMTAGRGIVHSEMPEQEKGLLWGFQLWVNLPARDKMRAPRYQEFAAGKIPEIEPAPGVLARVIAGKVGGVEGPVRGIDVAPEFLDLRLDKGAAWTVPVTPGHTAFAYVYKGEAKIGDEIVPRGTTALLSDGETLAVAAHGKAAGLLLIAGQPLDEPVVRYGPFVMNSREEILEAFKDYEAGRF